MPKICLDSGHGGKDPGAVGPSGLAEAPVALSIVEHLKGMLESLGQSVKLTRSSDNFVELGERCSLSNTWGADYFVSVHCNSDGATALGVETLYASDSGKALALPVQKAIVAASGDRDRGLVRRGDLYVLNATRCPAILAEVGFISNPATEAKLKNDDYRKRIATAIKDGLAEYLKLPGGITPPPDPTPPPPEKIRVTISAPASVEVLIIETPN